MFQDILNIARRTLDALFREFRNVISVEDGISERIAALS